jgi:hypothetical protein
MRSQDQARRIAGTTLAVASALVVFLGCTAAQRPAGPKPDFAGRSAQYRSLAIVCAPAPGAEPGHCPAIMAQVEKMAPSRLDFLERADVLPNAEVDTATDPATVRLKDAAAYDGIVALVYSVPGPVVLDISVLDARTNQRVWREELSTKDPNVAARLERHGFWTPTTLKKFYGRD